MSTVKADTVQPKDFASDITLGASGDTVTVAADSINVNKVQDKGGNTLWDFSGGSGFVSTNPAFNNPDFKLLATTTVSGASSVEFKTGIDSTYGVYIFKFIGMNPSVEDALYFQCSTDGGSNYNLVMTTTWWWAYHKENGTSALARRTDVDQSYGSGMQSLTGNTSPGSDFSLSGELQLFNPSSSTYIKNFHARCDSYGNTTWQMDAFVGGYWRTPDAINAIKFTYGSGNMDAGTIKMYGLL